MASVIWLKRQWKINLLVFLLVVIFAYFTNYHAQLFLAYLKVAVWPTFFLFFLTIFKSEIRSLLKNIKRLEILGNNLTIGTEESQNLAVEGASVVAEKANASISEAPSSLDAEMNPIQASDAILKRDLVERIIRSSAEWGHNMAVLGFKTTPIPQITWNQNGTPQIQFGVGSGQSVLSPNDQADRDVLIKEILKIRREIESLGIFDQLATGIGPTKESSLRSVLKDLESRLRRIDPTSVFLPSSGSA